jgi:hypothetical protein
LHPRVLKAFLHSCFGNGPELKEAKL